MKAKWIATTVAACALFLTGCASSNLAFDFDADEAVGTWAAGENLGTELTLKPDGSLTATDWPVAIACSETRVDNTEELRGSERRDVAGVWESIEEQTYTLFMRFDSESCAYTGGTTVNVWRDEDGAFDLCFVVPVGDDPDSLTADQWFVLHKEAEAEARSCS